MDPKAIKEREREISNRLLFINTVLIIHKSFQFDLHRNPSHTRYATISHYRLRDQLDLDLDLCVLFGEIEIDQ